MLVRWPDGKHRSWTTIDHIERSAILSLLRARRPTEDVLQLHPTVTVGTLAAVKAWFNR
jgi:hypothetical protein